MNDCRYIQFLVEDYSGEVFIREVLNKYFSNKDNFIYDIHSYHGIGKLPKKIGKIHELKTNTLLNELPKRLSGLNKALSGLPYKSTIIVVLDCDRNDCKELKTKLLNVISELRISIDTFFCIAIEEIEAWMLGDADAILLAYPHAKLSVLNSYEQDSTIGTWELLANAIEKRGVQGVKLSNKPIGQYKIQWAQRIGSYINIKNNRSPSFKYFISKLDLLG